MMAVTNRQHNTRQLSFDIGREVLSLYGSKLWDTHRDNSFKIRCGELWSASVSQPVTQDIRRLYASSSDYTRDMAGSSGPLLDAFISILTRHNREPRLQVSDLTAVSGTESYGQLRNNRSNSIMKQVEADESMKNLRCKQPDDNMTGLTFLYSSPFDSRLFQGLLEPFRFIKAGSVTYDNSGEVNMFIGEANMSSILEGNLSCYRLYISSIARHMDKHTEISKSNVLFSSCYAQDDNSSNSALYSPEHLLDTENLPTEPTASMCETESPIKELWIDEELERPLYVDRSSSYDGYVHQIQGEISPPVSDSARSQLYIDTGYHSEVTSLGLGSARSNVSAHSNLSMSGDTTCIHPDMPGTHGSEVPSINPIPVIWSSRSEQESHRKTESCPKLTLPTISSCEDEITTDQLLVNNSYGCDENLEQSYTPCDFFPLETSGSSVRLFGSSDDLTSSSRTSIQSPRSCWVANTQELNTLTLVEKPAPLLSERICQSFGGVKIHKASSLTVNPVMAAQNIRPIVQLPHSNPFYMNTQLPYQHSLYIETAIRHQPRPTAMPHIQQLLMQPVQHAPTLKPTSVPRQQYRQVQVKQISPLPFGSITPNPITHWACTTGTTQVQLMNASPHTESAQMIYTSPPASAVVNPNNSYRLCSPQVMSKELIRSAVEQMKFQASMNYLSRQ